MPRKTPPSFDFFPDDFVGGTMHMDAIEVGMYMRSICFQWGAGALPNDIEKLQRITGVSMSDFQRHWPVVLEKFIDNGTGGLVNERLQVERDKKLAISESRSKSGQKGGQANASNLLKQKGKQKQSKGKKEEGSRKKEEGRGKKEDGSSSTGSTKIEYSAAFEAFWSACPRKEAKGYAAECFDRAIQIQPADFITRRIVEFAARQWPAKRIALERDKCPHPSTWLNQCRWDDEISDWSGSSDGKQTARFSVPVGSVSKTL